MTKQGRVFLGVGVMLVALEILFVFVLQPAQWVSADIVGVYSIGNAPAATVAFGLIATFAALSLLVSAARRIGDPTRDFHRMHRNPRLARWAVASGMTATAGGIILSFAFCNFFTVAGYVGYTELPDALPLGLGVESFAANWVLGIALELAAGISAIAWLVARAVVERRPVAA